MATLGFDQLQILYELVVFICELGIGSDEANLYDNNPSLALLEKVNEAGGPWRFCLALSSEYFVIIQPPDTDDRAILKWHVDDNTKKLTCEVEVLLGYSEYYSRFIECIESYLEEHGLGG